ncbi:MAG: hypothetical protein MUF11_08625 [Beijerinckiaceae bacterium]|jgi:hypothetical protein|nr:hypothetical protein [Beijerinckiaceae bacterium]
MSSFRTFAIVSFAVLALGSTAQAKGNGGGATGGNGEPGGVMNPVASPISFVARPNNPNRMKRPGRGRAGAQILCSGGSTLMSPARCQWD